MTSPLGRGYEHIPLGYVTGKTEKPNETRAGILFKLLWRHTQTHTHTDGVGVKQPFKPNEGVMMEWEWLLQLVIVIVKPLTVSLYSYHKIIDRDGRGLAGRNKTQNEKKNPPQNPSSVIMTV